VGRRPRRLPGRQRPGYNCWYNQTNQARYIVRTVPGLPQDAAGGCATLHQRCHRRAAGAAARRAAQTPRALRAARRRGCRAGGRLGKSPGQGTRGAACSSPAHAAAAAANTPRRAAPRCWAGMRHARARTPMRPYNTTPPMAWGRPARGLGAILLLGQSLNLSCCPHQGPAQAARALALPLGPPRRQPGRQAAGRLTPPPPRAARWWSRARGWRRASWGLRCRRPRRRPRPRPQPAFGCAATPAPWW
jgi:hypothetical protein